MPHQSGYYGKILWDINSEHAPGWSTAIQSWDLRYHQRQLETPVMGVYVRNNPWTSVSLGLAEWTADVLYLVNSLVVSGDMSIGLEVTIFLYVNSVDYFSGTGITQTGTVSVPLDGPITSTVRIRGLSSLEHFAAV